ncbi:MAG: AbrB/MazE/SpoVT family DNA-binding domain-containing protein [Nanoarchaeota archaeon]
MIELKTKLKRWGNSFGIVVPISFVEKEGVKEGEEVVILMKKEKKNVLRETFGTYKFNKSTKQMMKEMDKELYNE